MSQTLIYIGRIHLKEFRDIRNARAQNSKCEGARGHRTWLSHEG